jgi:hypothetical protein
LGHQKRDLPFRQTTAGPKMALARLMVGYSAERERRTSRPLAAFLK